MLSELFGSILFIMNLILGPVDQALLHQQGLAAHYQQSINLSVNPCEDFYTYTCGKLIETEHQPEGLEKLNMSNVNPLVENTLEIDRQTELILTSNKTSKNLDRLRTFYKACLAWKPSEYEKTKMERFIFLSNNLLDSPYGNENFTELDDYTWYQRVGNAINQRNKKVKDTHVFLQLTTERDPDRHGKAIIVIGKRVSSFQFTQVDFVKKTVPNATFIKLEHLSNALSNLTSSPNATSQVMSIDELQIKAPGIDWNLLIKAVFDLRKLEIDLRVRVVDLAYIKQMSLLLAKYNSTSDGQSVLADWIRLKTLTENMISSYNHDDCLELTQENLGAAVTHELLMLRSQIELSNARQELKEIAERVRMAFGQLIYEANWTSSNSKIDLLDKLKAIDVHLLYMDEMTNATFVDNYYTNLTLSPTSHYTNILNLYLHYDEMRTDNNSRFVNAFASWRPEAKAYYLPGSNSVNVQFAAAQGRMFVPGRSGVDYANYGSVGYVLGHEFGHALDLNGVMYGADGGLVVNIFRDRSSKAMFRSRARNTMACHHENKIDETIRLSSAPRTLNEDLADNAVRAAYKAYVALEPELGQDRPLASYGVDLNRRQLFWVSAARVWCNTMSPSAINHLAITDTHSNLKHRVNINLMNTAEFRLDFKCPAKNATESCQFW